MSPLGRGERCRSQFAVNRTTELDSDLPSMRFFRFIPGLCAVLWLFAVGAGIRILARYESTPGNRGPAPVLWPSETTLRRDSTRATLVMVLHPRCPCSRASLGELAELMAQSQDLVSTTVLFYQPAGFQEGWAKTDLWRRAGAIPGVSRIIDLNGREARRFGGVTSGQTSLYDEHGRLLFQGGITRSRGHEGDNPGRSALVSWVTKRAAAVSVTSVFGCPVFDPASETDNQLYTCKLPR